MAACRFTAFCGLYMKDSYMILQITFFRMDLE